jgi:thiamine-phosphate pyrophosphorylase
MRKMTTDMRGLYAMVDLPTASPVTLTEQLIEGGARSLQLRGKHASGAELFAVGRVLHELCRARGVTFIVNDRLDIALALAADGVHLGQDDLPLAVARALCQPGFIIGVSTHNLAQARAAHAGGADYIGFGPVFATSSKVNPDPIVGIEQLREVCQLPLPVVAIGGITLDHVTAVAAAGATGVAIISAINHAPDVIAAARRAHAAF